MSPAGWLTTAMQCVVCSRKWTATHPFDANVLTCPDCGHTNAVDQGVRQ